MIGLPFVPLFNRYGIEEYVPDCNSIVSPGYASDNDLDKSFVVIILEFIKERNNNNKMVNIFFIEVFFYMNYIFFCD